MKKFLLPLAAVALTAGSAAAQRPIVPGELTRGSLGSSDPRNRDDSYYDEWAFSGRRGETVIVTMESGAFDTYLYLGTLRRGNYQEIARDDDGGDGTSSRIQVRLPEDGSYVIRASSLRQRTGPYTLTLVGGRAADDAGWDDDDSEPIDPVYGDPGTGYDRRDGGPLSAGDRVRGRLSDADPSLDNGAAFHLYTYQARRGERLTLTLRSQEFDAYLVIGTRGGRHGIGTVVARDDDGAGGRDSRIDVALPTAGEYVIRVNSLMPATGEYTLEVESSLGGGSPRPRPGEYDDEDDYADSPGALDQRLVGRWGLTVPGARVQGDDWSSVSAGATMGILTVDESGAYTWRKNGRTLRGQLVPFTPRRDAQPGTRYFSINDGRDEYYVFFTRSGRQRYMQVNARRTGEVVAHGYREGGSY
ncbi:MAG TPA: PPC domain-containing protein [Longimicrobium sp.]|nr:PPC domain-containing protein [Longimicrobium sp.]